MKKEKAVSQIKKLKTKELGVLRTLGKWWKASWRKVLVVVGVAGLIVYFKSAVVVGLVNGRPIFRSSFNQEVKKQAGQQIFDTMVTKKLILQEAKKLNVKISQAEIDEELARIEELATQQGITLEDLLAQQQLTKTQLIEEVRLQKIVEVILSDKVQVTDEEVTQFLEDNADYLPETESQEELVSLAKEQINQQKTSQEVQGWIGELQEKAKVVSWL